MTSRKVVGLLAASALLVAGAAGGATPSDSGSTTSGATSNQDTGSATSLYPGSPTPATESAPDASPAELGLRFRTSQPGRVVGVRYYKSAENTGRHRVTLWSGSGQQLATRRITTGTGAGWRTVKFADPVPIAAGSPFVASYHTRTGHYSVRVGAFDAGPRGNDLVTGLAGVHEYGPHAFPTKTWRGSEYYVEPVFRPDTAGTSQEPSPPAPSPSTSVDGGHPDAASTGSTGALETIPGRTITTAGTHLQNVRVEGQLTIKADDVVLDNVHVVSDDTYGVLVWGRNTTIRDTTIEGSGGTLAGLAAYEQGSFDARRISVSGTEDGVRLADDCVLADSYVHDLRGTASSHYDAVTADGYTGWRIVHNTILNQYGQTAAVWVGDSRYSPSEGVLQDNLLGGGGYVVYAGPGTGAGVRVLDNVFTTRFHPRSGYWGPVTGWVASNNTWSGNTWLDGAHAGEAVSP